MKKVLIAALIGFATFCLFGKDAFEFVNDNDGYSYIQINEDLDAFSFKSDFKSIGNSGMVGYVVYAEGLENEQRAEYIRANAGNAQFGKKVNGGIVDLGALKAGDRVGFYLERNNGDIVYKTLFTEKHGVDYLEFSKNGVGQGKDEWMSINNVHATSASTPPSGAPLPGILAVILVGGLGSGAVFMKKRKSV